MTDSDTARAAQTFMRNIIVYSPLIILKDTETTIKELVLVCSMCFHRQFNYLWCFLDYRSSGARWEELLDPTPAPHIKHVEKKKKKKDGGGRSDA